MSFDGAHEYKIPLFGLAGAIVGGLFSEFVLDKGTDTGYFYGSVISGALVGALGYDVYKLTRE